MISKTKFINHPIIIISKKLMIKSLNQIVKVWIKNFIYFMIVFLYTEGIRQVLLRIPGLQQFPPSVVGMILFCIFLVIIEKCLPSRYIHRFLSLFQSQAEFAIRYLNIMIVPSTLNIINSNSINGIQFIKIAVLFGLAYVVLFLFCIGSVKSLRFLLYYSKNNDSNNPSEKNDTHHDTLSLPTIHTNHPPSIPTHMQPSLTSASASSSIDSIDKIEQQHQQIVSNKSRHSSITIHDTKNIIIQEENEHRDDRIIVYNNENTNSEDENNNNRQVIEKEGKEKVEDIDIDIDIDEWLKNKWHQYQPSIDFLILFIIFNISTLLYIALPNNHSLLPSTRLVSQLTLTILVYFLMLHTPPKMKLIINPLVSTTAIMLACLGYLQWIKVNNNITTDELSTYPIVKSAVHMYYTNSHNFFTWLEGTPVDGFAGAGDVLSSSMNVAIVSLALTVFLNKPKDFRQWIILLITAMPMVFISLLLVPLIAHRILIPTEIALAMTTRTITAAIAIPISQIIHSNVGIVTCMISFSGIFGPLIGTRLLKWTKVKQDDYLTIGICMGFNSHAIATAYLYETNRKASSISSLSFMLFGILSVIFTFVPQISNAIMSNVGVI
ncbi:unnamed protein product [Cunninghamella blakesleeana]